MIFIRPEKSEDIEIIYGINKLAFGGETEAKLIDKIRKSENFIPQLSMVALKNDMIVGHILFSKVKIKNIDKEKTILVLAPMSVLPEFQKQGIGSLLVTEGLEKSKNMGYSAVTLIGHPDYYPRFGFMPARTKRLEISLKMEIPDEAFMVCELGKDTLNGITGIIEFPKYFEEE